MSSTAVTLPTPLPTPPTPQDLFVQALDDLHRKHLYIPSRVLESSAANDLSYDTLIARDPELLNAIFVAAVSVRPGHYKGRSQPARGSGRRALVVVPTTDQMNPKEDISDRHCARLCLWGGNCWARMELEDIFDHICSAHGFGPTYADAKEKGYKLLCEWPGCAERLAPDCLRRHVQLKHLDNRIMCGVCGERDRQDAYLKFHGLAKDCEHRSEDDFVTEGEDESSEPPCPDPVATTSLPVAPLGAPLYHPAPQGPFPYAAIPPLLRPSWARQGVGQLQNMPDPSLLGLYTVLPDHALGPMPYAPIPQHSYPEQAWMNTQFNPQQVPYAAITYQQIAFPDLPLPAPAGNPATYMQYDPLLQGQLPVFAPVARRPPQAASLYQQMTFPVSAGVPDMQYYPLAAQPPLVPQAPAQAGPSQLQAPMQHTQTREPSFLELLGEDAMDFSYFNQGWENAASYGPSA